MLHLIIKKKNMNKEFIGNLMNINSLCWAFYYVNGGSKVDVNVSTIDALSYLL
jgi:hypothetical protein